MSKINLYKKIAGIFYSLEDKDEVLREFFWGSYNQERIYQWESYIGVWKDFHARIDALGIDISYVDHIGGEGEGEEYWSVYEFRTPYESTFIKFDGYYQSYDGSTFTEFYEVKPKQRMVTFYEK